MKKELWYIGGAAALALFFFGTSKALSMNATATANKIVDEIGDEIKASAARWSIPWRRIAAHVYTESSGNASATGAAGERGLMQLKPVALADVNANTGSNFSFADMYDPVQNIRAGSAFLALQLKRVRSAGLGDIDSASQAFNAGFRAFQLDNTKGLAYLSKVKEKETFFA